MERWRLRKIQGGGPYRRTPLLKRIPKRFSCRARKSTCLPKWRRHPVLSSRRGGRL